MNEPVIRRMCRKDLETVADIEEATFAHPWSRDSFRKELEENRVARYLVAEVDGQTVGYAGAWIVMDESHITNIAVAEAFRGQGIGKKLTAALLQYLSNLGAGYATLEVRVSNQRAIRMYQSLGFESVGKRKKYYEDNGEDAYLMVCQTMPEVDPEFTEPAWESFL